MTKSRSIAARDINEKIIRTYWEIGKIIVEKEQDGKIKSQYGQKLLIELSKELSNHIGRGFSRSNLANMRLFYLTYPIVQSAAGQLTWTHYCELLPIKDKDARSFYEQESINSNWSVRELKRQIETSLFERLLLSDGKANKDKVLALSRKGIELNKPEEMLRAPFVLEFLGNRENKPILEKELEYRLIRHIEDFLLELGRGFMFVGSQKRINIGKNNYYIDMVFYNKILKSYVLIDLKRGEMKAEYAGQMNQYLNYYQTEVNDKSDNAPIGIILCKGVDNIEAEYALGGISNQVFASSYIYYIPDKQTLVDELNNALKQEKDITNG
ncbi:MAG: PDDEXK nuclease domain-containing protein [Elusimicrobiota bacterium]|nr:PDDEXK nuclease domain-containing protein [Elusimicrobiota bacterium]